MASAESQCRVGRGRCWGCLFECTLIHLVFPEHLLCAGEGMEGSETFLWQRAGKRFTLIPHRRASSRGDAPDHQVESSGFHQPGQPWCLLIPGKPEDPGPSHYQPLPSLQPTGSRIFHLDLDRWVGLSLSVVRGGAVGLSPCQVGSGEKGALQRTGREDTCWHDWLWTAHSSSQGCRLLRTQGHEETSRP